MIWSFESIKHKSFSPITFYNFSFFNLLSVYFNDKLVSRAFVLIWCIDRISDWLTYTCIFSYVNLPWNMLYPIIINLLDFLLYTYIHTNICKHSILHNFMCIASSINSIKYFQFHKSTRCFLVFSSQLFNTYYHYYYY